MRRYRRILAIPSVRRLVIASVLGRIPLGALSLSLLLYVSDVTGSFATSGVVTGALGIGVAISIPVGGRLVDRIGLRVLPWTAVLQAGALAGVIALGESDAAAPALVAGALVVGLATPPLSATLRALWPRLLEPDEELLTAAYAFDSALVESVFLGGPALAGALYGLVGPTAPLLVAIATVLAGTLWFARLVPGGAPRAAAAQRLWGALASRGLRTLALVALPVGFALGSFEVSVVRACQDAGQAGLSGALLALWAAASAVGGLLFGALASGRSHLVRTYVVTVGLLPPALVPMLLDPSLAAMAPLVVIAGLPIAPQFATTNQLASSLAPAGTHTEAVGWPLTMVFAGVALGAAGTGVVAGSDGAVAGFGLAIAASALATALAALSRGALARDLRALGVRERAVVGDRGPGGPRS